MSSSKNIDLYRDFGAGVTHWMIKLKENASHGLETFTVSLSCDAHILVYLFVEILVQSVVSK
jgi:hypothetical protein